MCSCVSLAVCDACLVRHEIESERTLRYSAVGRAARSSTEDATERCRRSVVVYKR